MKKSIALLMLVFLVAGCGGDSSAGKPNADGSEKAGWDQTSKDLVVSQCSLALVTKILDSDKRHSLCQCVIDGVAKLYTPEQFNDNTSQAKSDTERLTRECATNLGIPTT